MSYAMLRAKFSFGATCAYCGGEGRADSSGNAAQWNGHELIHVDRRVCMYNIRKRQRGNK